MQCVYCNNEIPSDKKECPSCGAVITQPQCNNFNNETLFTVQTGQTMKQTSSDIDVLFPPVNQNLSSESVFGCYLDAWRKWKENKGRSRRKEFWSWLIINNVLLLPLLIIVVFPGVPEEHGIYETITAFAGTILLIGSIFTLIPTFNLLQRRLQDINIFGLVGVLGIIPYIGWLFILIIACIDGTAGPNRYGLDPKGRW